MIYLNGSPLNVTLFPDNTSQVWKLPKEILNETNWANVKWDFQHEGEFLHLAQLKMLLDEYQVEASLTLSYLPYGRQDKMISNDRTFALNTFAVLLNTLAFKNVVINDPHSEIALELIKNSKAKYSLNWVEIAHSETNADAYCYPDKGAKVKYSKLFEIPHLYGEKVRNQSTGHIESYALHGNPKGANILIVDDICDGGMTFIMLAQELYKAGANEVNLFVSHGVFSKGLTPLYEAGIKNIYTSKGKVSTVQGNIVYKETT